MTQVRIGSARIADRMGTHEPDEVVDYPSAELLELARAGTVDPESGLPYCTLYDPSAPARPSRASKAADPAVAPEAAPAPENA